MNVIDVVIPVYNDAPYLSEILKSINEQELPADWGVHVFIVDDGSDVPIELDSPYKAKKEISLIQLEKNSGRGGACNAGASKGVGSYIYILDADCVLRKKNILSLHISNLLDQGVSASCGGIYKNDNSFWARYQNGVAKQREASFLQGDLSALTTANFMIKREAFEAINGFDELFTEYGFEDKDLLLRLIEKGVGIGQCGSAAVEHMCDLSLISIVGKMERSGQFSSSLFIDKHPETYQKMAYSKADIRFSKGGLNLLAFLTKPLIRPIAILLDGAIRKEWLPFSVAKKMVKYTSGLAYMQGTRIREK